MVLHILFVCTGNICRSPTAERLAAAYARRSEIPDLTVSSAGIRAVIAHPIHRDAATVIEAMGGDPTQFAARQLKPNLMSEADLVVTMTKAHRDAALQMAPAKLKRTFTLCEASLLVSAHGARCIDDLSTLRPHLTAQQIIDIPDPIGQTPEFFASVGSRIAEFLPPILDLCRAQ